MFANKLKLDIFNLKTNFFCKNVILKIAIINNTNYAIILLQKILTIVSNYFNNSLFNINESVFNKKQIINVLCVTFYSLKYNNYYTSYFVNCDATTKIRNINISKTIIMLLN